MSLMSASSLPSLVAAGITKILLIVQEDVTQTSRHLRHSCLFREDDDRPVFSVDMPVFIVLRSNM